MPVKIGHYFLIVEDFVKKRIIILASVLMTFCGISAFGWGIGVEGGLPFVGNLPGSNVMLTFKLDGAPLIGVGAEFGNNSARLAGIFDFWLLQEPLAGMIGIYLGPGVYASLGFSNPPSVAVGARLPIGLQIFPLHFLELFIEVAPAIGVYFHPYADFGWNVQAAAGIRFWFNRK